MECGDNKFSVVVIGRAVGILQCKEFFEICKENISDFICSNFSDSSV